MHQIGICGHFGNGKTLLNGQTVKTKVLTDEIVNQIGQKKILTLDTHNWSKNPIGLLISSLLLIQRCSHIIILPAKRGVKIFVPLFLLLNKIFNRKLHYVVIGGWLPEMLHVNPKLTEQLKGFNGIYVETYTMIQALNVLGLNNVYYLPNVKPLIVLSKDELIYPKETPYNLCTFSRVMQEKGIEDAIEAVKKINSERNTILYTLDIYGQIDKAYEERFQQLKKEFPNSISYKGLVHFDKSTEIIKNYFALLFPTYYEGEGFPGTVLDAFSSGIPVIATNWKYNSEVIHHGKVGFIYECGRNNLALMLNKILENPDSILEMKNNCLLEAKKYDTKTVVQLFLTQMERV